MFFKIEKSGNLLKINIFKIKIKINTAKYKINNSNYIFRTHKSIMQQIRYSFIKFFHPNLITIQGIELSNCCNLKCPNCCTPTTKYKKGFATKETVLKAFKYMPPGNYCSFHRLGEPLLHPDFLKYLKMAYDLGFKTCVSTNGILLTEDIARKIIEANPSIVYISLHTKQSVEAFKMFYLECIKANWMPETIFGGNMLEHNREDVLRWLDECEVTEEMRKYVRDLSSHSWAGNVESRKTDYDKETVARRIKNCTFIKNNIANVRWDGTIVACCLDSENYTQIGTIDEIEKVKQNPEGYQMCVHCDPSWINGEAV